MIAISILAAFTLYWNMLIPAWAFWIFSAGACLALFLNVKDKQKKEMNDE